MLLTGFIFIAFVEAKPSGWLERQQRLTDGTSILIAWPEYETLNLNNNINDIRDDDSDGNVES